MNKCRAALSSHYSLFILAGDIPDTDNVDMPLCKVWNHKTTLTRRICALLQGTLRVNRDQLLGPSGGSALVEKISGSIFAIINAISFMLS